MKIHKTKEELREEAELEAKLALEQINEKLTKSNEVEVSFDRNDFNEILSTNMGWGFQDLKPQFRTIITQLTKQDYILEFSLLSDETGFGAHMVIKKP